MADQSVPARPLNTGIYEIVNTINGKIYVGSAVHIGKRWICHRAQLNGKRHHNRHLQSSWDKHGPASFEFRRLLLCEKRDLLLYEQISIDAMRPEFNIERVAGSSVGCIRTPETRAKIAAKAKGRKCEPRSAEYRAKLSAAQKGRQKAPEHLAALQAGRKARVVSDEQRIAISAALKRSWDAGSRSRIKSPETRAKISAALTGVALSPERRAKQSAAQLGKAKGPYGPRSQEVKDRMAALRKGKPNPMLGRKRSPEAIEAVSRALRGRKLSAEHKDKIGACSRVSWSDPETRARIIEAQKASRKNMVRKPLTDEQRMRASAAHRILSDDQVREIRCRRASGEKLQPIADDFSCSTATISNIRSGKSYSHVSESPGCTE